MKCFQHITNEANAVCRACGRAVCRECELDAEGDVILCSADCRSSHKKSEVTQMAVLELALATAKSYKGLIVVFKLIAAVLFLFAFAVLTETFLLVRFIDGLQAVHPVTSCAIAAILVLLGVICLYAAKSISPTAKRYDDLVQQIFK